MALKDKLLLRLSPKTVIRNSPYFDEEWYRGTYGIKTDCAAHYLEEGWLKDYDPSKRFSTKDYLINNPDIQGINPLLHFEVFGKNEGRRAFAVRRQASGSCETKNISVPYEAYEKAIDEKDVVSFDVFDTLVIRPFLKAEDLFSYLETEYGCQDFARKRKEAEAKARDILKKEVNIDEIYSFLDENCSFLKQKEIESEILFCRPYPVMKKVYETAREKGKRVIATSDMYLPGSVVKQILDRSGYVMDEIRVSCDFGKTKGKGDLYSLVLEEEGISAEEMVHFGDNYLSDYSAAASMGIEAFETPKIVDLISGREENRFLRDYLGLCDTLASSIYVSLACEYLLEGDHPCFEKIADLLAGPLALGYLIFLCEEGKKDEIDGFLFAARDGHALKELYEKYFKEECGIDGAYAYLSRACIASAGLRNGLFAPETAGKVFDADRFRKEDDIGAWSKKRDEDLGKHLEDIAEGKEKIATVDMFSGNYTSQKGAAHYLGGRVKEGFYAGNFAEGPLDHKSFGERLLGMRDNLPVKMSEFLITSWEGPIIGVDEIGRPIYEYDPGEEKRERYETIMKGIGSYFDDHLKLFGKKKEYVLSLEEWLDLMDRYLRDCSDEEIGELSKIIDSEGTVSSSDDPSIAGLIAAYREKGY